MGLVIVLVMVSVVVPLAAKRYLLKRPVFPHETWNRIEQRRILVEAGPTAASGRMYPHVRLLRRVVERVGRTAVATAEAAAGRRAGVAPLDGV